MPNLKALDLRNTGLNLDNYKPVFEELFKSKSLIVIDATNNGLNGTGAGSELNAQSRARDALNKAELDGNLHDHTDLPTTIISLIGEYAMPEHLETEVTC